jgi:hypothetical protein
MARPLAARHKALKGKLELQAEAGCLYPGWRCPRPRAVILAAMRLPVPARLPVPQTTRSWHALLTALLAAYVLDGPYARVDSWSVVIQVCTECLQGEHAPESSQCRKTVQYIHQLCPLRASAYPLVLKDAGHCTPNNPPQKARLAGKGLTPWIFQHTSRILSSSLLLSVIHTLIAGARLGAPPPPPQPASAQPA